MHAVRDVAVLEVLEGDEVRADRAGEAEGPGAFPPEGLAGGEGEGQGELGLGEVERDPLWGFGGERLAD